MRKQEFLDALHAGLSGLTEADVLERLTFYSEMIDDRMEEGLSEEEAVSKIGNVEDIVQSVLSEVPQKTQENLITHVEKPTHIAPKPREENKKRMSARQIVLLCLGAPLWLPLLITAFAVLISVLAALWSVAVSLWAVFASLVGVCVGCVLGGVAYSIYASAIGGIATVGIGLVSAGLSIPMFYGCVAATKGCAWLTGTVCRVCVKFLFGRGRTE